MVLNWNRPVDTVDCVRSLHNAESPGLEIIVVDNGSTDDSVAQFEAKLAGVPLIRRSTNGGYAAGNNVGIRRALTDGADYVLILNNDVIVTPGFLPPMLAEAEADASVGIVTCDARFQSDHSRSYPTAGRISKLRGAGVALSSRDRAQRSIVDFVSGCILLVRRAVFEKVGFLDESFFMYFEDVEYSRRVGRAFRMVYTPEATVYHLSGGGDSWARQTPTYLHYMARNRFLAFHNERPLYRAYLLLVGWAAATAKSGAILLRSFRPGRISTAREQLSALWSGLWEGMRLA